MPLPRQDSAIHQDSPELSGQHKQEVLGAMQTAWYTLRNIKKLSKSDLQKFYDRLQSARILVSARMLQDIIESICYAEMHGLKHNEEQRVLHIARRSGLFYTQLRIQQELEDRKRQRRTKRRKSAK